VVVVVVVGEMKTVIAKSWHKCVELYRWLCDRRSAAAIPFSFYYQDRVCILCNIHDCYYLFISLTDRRWPTKPSQPPRDNIFFFPLDITQKKKTIEYLLSHSIEKFIASWMEAHWTRINPDFGFIADFTWFIDSTQRYKSI
jgi:hypothetical protein